MKTKPRLSRDHCPRRFHVAHRQSDHADARGRCTGCGAQMFQTITTRVRPGKLTALRDYEGWGQQ